MGLQDKTQKLFDKAVELDKKILKKIEDKLNLSDYQSKCCLLYTSPSPRDRQKSRMPSSA